MGEDRAEGLDFLLVHVAMRLDRHVAAGQSGAARGQDHVELGVGAPVAQPGRDLVAVVGDDIACGQRMARVGQALDQRVARTVLVQRAGIADGQDGDAHGDEFLGLVDAAHVESLALRDRRSAQASRLASDVRKR